jgi:hypothetical protein
MDGDFERRQKASAFLVFPMPLIVSWTGPRKPNAGADRPQPGGAVVGGVCCSFVLPWWVPSWLRSASSAGLGRQSSDDATRNRGGMGQCRWVERLRRGQWWIAYS